MGLAHSVLTAEFIDATAAVYNLLFARVKRVAFRTHFYVQFSRHRRPRRKGIAATAGYVHFTVFRMDIGLHGETSVKRPRTCPGAGKTGRAVYLAPTALARLSATVS